MTRYYDGEPTHRCRLCMDSGLVPVWKRASREMVLEGEAIDMDACRVHSMRVICTCSVGQQKTFKAATYDPERMLFYESGNLEAVFNWQPQVARNFEDQFN